jgi:hypothetical protein
MTTFVSYTLSIYGPFYKILHINMCTYMCVCICNLMQFQEWYYCYYYYQHSLVKKFYLEEVPCVSGRDTVELSP